MALVNRCAIVVSPKQPYIDWANGHSDHAFSVDDFEPHVYLGPDTATPDDMKKVVKDSWRCLFDLELDGWITEPSMWPQKRNLKIFHEWFDVRVASSVNDMCEWPLERDED